MTVGAEVAMVFTSPVLPTYNDPCESEGSRNAEPNVDEAVENSPLNPMTVDVALYPLFTVNGNAKVEPVFVIVKFGYVPVTEIPVPLLRTTVWSGAEFVICKLPPMTERTDESSDMPVPADIVPVATLPSVEFPVT